MQALPPDLRLCHRGQPSSGKHNRPRPPDTLYKFSGAAAYCCR